MTIVIPEWVLSLAGGLFMLAGIMVALIAIGSIIAGYFYSREMSRLDPDNPPDRASNADAALVARAQELIAELQKLTK